MESLIWNAIQESLETLVNGTLVVAIAVLGQQLRLLLAERLTAERHEIVRALAATVVTAVEQEYKAVNGSEKLARATALLEERLAAAGIQLELDDMRVAIESAVFDELNRWKQSP